MALMFGDEKSEIFQNKPFRCMVEGCNASYTKLYRLKIHARKHSGERPFQCEFPGCTLSYTNSAHLRRHKYLVHEKSSEVLCKEKGCGQVLNNKYSLKKHYNQVHSTVKNTFSCAECLESFKMKRQLKQHLKLHTTEVSLKCSRCNIKFTRLHQYNNHKSKHKTFTCDCGITFEKWSLFCEHRKTSCNIKKIDHQCIICKKTFTTSTNLKQHSLTHVEESQKDVYRCPYMDCTRSYKYKKNLTYHIAVFHEKVNNHKRIRCTVPGCEQDLKSQKNLKQHIVNMHSGKSKKKKKPKVRRDKGKPKMCMASVMSGVELPSKEHAIIINSVVHNKIPPVADVLSIQCTVTGYKENVQQQSNNAILTESEESKHLQNNDRSKDSKNEDKVIENSEEGTISPNELDNVVPSGSKHNLHSLDDNLLLQYCDDVLKVIDHQILNTEPASVLIQN